VDLLDELLLAPDRDHCPGALPVVSVSGREDAAFGRALRAARRERLVLSRRGAWHGEFAVLEPARAPAAPPPCVETFAGRWLAARPIVLPDIVRDLVAAEREELALADRLHVELSEKGRLRRLVEQRLERAGEVFEPLALTRPLHDKQRDLERVFLASPPPTPRGRKVQDLWVKSGWLSTFDEDRSLRVRVSFGAEREDDASDDLLRQRLVARLAAAVLPAAGAVAAHPALRALIEGLAGEPPLLTQAIAYWNAPEGGALFHHDAFHEQGGETAQLGVCYVQLTGATFWLALSTQDLAERVREFVDLLAEGDLRWVRARLAPAQRDFRALEELAGDPGGLERELGLPGCGRLAALVNHGPEFSALLADAGHAALLQAGDAILLPNHGPACTAMHSVFCAGEETGYSLSLAIRPDREG
jgi:hypothetical protein